MEPTKQTKIEVLKLVIASYQYFADGKGSRLAFYKKYVPEKYKGYYDCPACNAFILCEDCPCSYDNYTCTNSVNFIWKAENDLTNYKEKAIKRIAELTETLKKLEQ